MKLETTQELRQKLKDNLDSVAAVKFTITVFRFRKPEVLARQVRKMGYDLELIVVISMEKGLLCHTLHIQARGHSPKLIAFIDAITRLEEES